MTIRTRQRASATVYVIIVMGITSVLLMALLVFVLAQVRFSLHQVHRAEALQAAEAGINFYRWYLAHETDGKTAAQIDAFWSGGTAYGVAAPYEVAYGDRGHYRITVTAPNTGQTSVTVRSDGWVGSDTDTVRTVEVRLRRPSWSEYSIMSNADTRFGDGTTTYGPVHSNGGIRFDGVARNIVSSARTTYVDPDSGATRPGVWTAWTGEYNTSMGSAVFRAGKEFPVATMDFAGLAGDFALLKAEAQAHGRYFDGTGYGRHITLRADGSFDVRTVTAYSPYSYNPITQLSSGTNGITTEGAVTTYQIPNDGVIYVEDNVWIDGTVSGKHVTVVAADTSGGTTPRIFLNNDLTYGVYDGSTVVGLIAAGDIDVPRDADTDLRIDAAMLAQSGRVGREHYRQYCVRYKGFNCQQFAWDYRNTVTVFGAIVSYNRYGFYWTDGTGYATRNLIYDNNLLYQPPPLFPTGTHYIPDLWREL